MNQATIEKSAVNVEITTFVNEAAKDTPMQIHKKIVTKKKLTKEAKLLQELTAAGRPIYTVAEVEARFNRPGKLKADTSQADLQELVSIGDVILPLRDLHVTASNVERMFNTPGRNGVLKVMSHIYELYSNASSSLDFPKVCTYFRKELGKKVRKNTRPSSLFIRYVFASFDDKQVSVHSTVLEYAAFKQCSVGDFGQFVKDNGSYEGIRIKAMHELPKTEKQAEAAKTKAEDQAAMTASPSFRSNIAPEALALAKSRRSTSPLVFNRRRFSWLSSSETLVILSFVSIQAAGIFFEAVMIRSTTRRASSTFQPS